MQDSEFRIEFPGNLNYFCVYNLTMIYFDGNPMRL